MRFTAIESFVRVGPAAVELVVFAQPSGLAITNSAGVAKSGPDARCSVVLGQLVVASELVPLGPTAIEDSLLLIIIVVAVVSSSSTSYNSQAHCFDVAQLLQQ